MFFKEFLKYTKKIKRLFDPYTFITWDWRRKRYPYFSCINTKTRASNSIFFFYIYILMLIFMGKKIRSLQLYASARIRRRREFFFKFLTVHINFHRRTITQNTRVVFFEKLFLVLIFEYFTRFRHAHVPRRPRNTTSDLFIRRGLVLLRFCSTIL